MKTNIKLIVALGVLLIAGLAATGMSYAVVTESTHETPADYIVNIQTKDGDTHEFMVELATDSDQQKQGLMFRKELLKNHGMLFLFGSNRQRSFWMRNTFIPLDIIFLERDGRIQHIHSMAKPQDDTFITSGKESFAVLEINGGLADQYEIREGDKVYHPAFGNMHLFEK